MEKIVKNVLETSKESLSMEFVRNRRFSIPIMDV